MRPRAEQRTAGNRPDQRWPAPRSDYWKRSGIRLFGATVLLLPVLLEMLAARPEPQREHAMTQESSPRPAGWGLPLGAGAGAGLGLVVGVLVNELAFGLLVGAALGTVVGAALTSLERVPPARRGAVVATAIALVLAGIATTVAVLLR